MAKHYELENIRLATDNRRLRMENQKLREAIVDALSGLTPGIYPHSVLTYAIKQAEKIGKEE